MSRTLSTLCLAILLVSGALGCGSVDRGAYVKANEDVFHQLAKVPRSQPQQEVSTDARAREDGLVVGYVTRFVFRVPDGVTAVADFECVGPFEVAGRHDRLSSSKLVPVPGHRL
jgi:hypothetical protein